MHKAHRLPPARGMHSVPVVGYNHRASTISSATTLRTPNTSEKGTLLVLLFTFWAETGAEQTKQTKQTKQTSRHRSKFSLASKYASQVKQRSKQLQLLHSIRLSFTPPRPTQPTSGSSSVGAQAHPHSGGSADMRAYTLLRNR